MPETRPPRTSKTPITKLGAGDGNVLTRHYGPLPGWAWVGIGAVTFVAGVAIARKLRGGSSTPAADAQGPSAGDAARAGIAGGGGGLASPPADPGPAQTGLLGPLPDTRANDNVDDGDATATPRKVLPPKPNPNSRGQSSIVSMPKTLAGVVIGHGTLRNPVSSLAVTPTYHPSTLDMATTRDRGLSYVELAPAGKPSSFGTVYTNAPSTTQLIGPVITGVNDPRYVSGERWVPVAGGLQRVA